MEGLPPPGQLPAPQCPGAAYNDVYNRWLSACMGGSKGTVEERGLTERSVSPPARIGAGRVFQCVTSGNWHNVRVAPHLGADQVSTIQRDEVVEVTDTYPDNVGTLWGKVGTGWTMLRSPEGKEFLREREAKRAELEALTVATQSELNSTLEVARSAREDAEALISRINPRPVPYPVSPPVAVPFPVSSPPVAVPLRVPAPIAVPFPVPAHSPAVPLHIAAPIPSEIPPPVAALPTPLATRSMESPPPVSSLPRPTPASPIARMLDPTIASPEPVPTPSLPIPEAVAPPAVSYPEPPSPPAALPAAIECPPTPTSAVPAPTPGFTPAALPVATPVTAAIPSPEPVGPEPSPAPPYYPLVADTTECEVPHSEPEPEFEPEPEPQPPVPQAPPQPQAASVSELLRPTSLSEPLYQPAVAEQLPTPQPELPVPLPTSPVQGLPVRYVEPQAPLQEVELLLAREVEPQVQPEFVPQEIAPPHPEPEPEAPIPTPTYEAQRATLVQSQLTPCCLPQAASPYSVYTPGFLPEHTPSYLPQTAPVHPVEVERQTAYMSPKREYSTLHAVQVATGGLGRHIVDRMQPVVREEARQVMLQSPVAVKARQVQPVVVQQVGVAYDAKMLRKPSVPRLSKMALSGGTPKAAKKMGPAPPTGNGDVKSRTFRIDSKKAAPVPRQKITKKKPKTPAKTIETVYSTENVKCIYAGPPMGRAT